MCESHAYVIRGDREEKVLDDVTFLRPENGSVRLRNLFGEEITIRGTIEKILFMDHKILIRESP
jgi:predicted RNA-binding protein